MMQSKSNIIIRRFASSASSKPRKFFSYTILGSTTVIAGVRAYAYYDPQFRKTLENNVPGFQTILKQFSSPSFSGSSKINPVSPQQSKPLEPLFPPAKPTVSLDDVSKLINEVVEKKFAEMTPLQKVELQEKVSSARLDFENELKNQLALHQSTQAAHEEEMLRSQRESLQSEHKKVLQQSVLKERKNYADKLATATAKLTALEVFLNGREEFDGQNRRAKKLWIACQNLRSLLSNSSEKSQPPRISATPISGIIVDITNAGNSDEFVDAVLKSLSKEALDRGVYTDDELIERYEKVKKICRRVATVNNDRPSLLQYILSTLQSFLRIDGSRETFGNSDIDVEKISNYEILSRASYCLQRKDFYSTLRLMSLLKGQASKVASDWLMDLRLHVETKQLADILVAHASAQSIRSLY